MFCFFVLNPNQEVQIKIACVRRLLDSLSNQKRIWEGKLTDTQSHLDCLPVESLLISAMLTYCNPLPTNLHTILWENWIKYCEGKVLLGSFSLDKSNAHKVNVKVASDLNVRKVLTEPDELLALERREIFSDDVSLEKALLWKIRSNKLFIQAVFDPDSVALNYIEGLHNNEDEEQTVNRTVHLKSTQTDLIEKLVYSIEQGSVCVLHVVLPIHTKLLCNAIQPLLTHLNGSEHNDLLINNQIVIPHSDFQLYIIVPLSISSQHPFALFLLHLLASEQLSNVELSRKGLSVLLHRHIVEESRRELSIQKRALLADLRMHQQSVLESEVCLHKQYENVKYMYSVLCSYICTPVHICDTSIFGYITLMYYGR